MQGNLAEFFGLGKIELNDVQKAAAVDTVKEKYHGTDLGDRTSLGLKQINSWNKNPSCINQQAGYSAEVISTARENFTADFNKTGVKTYRVDDLTNEVREQFGDRFASKNDQYVDKVRIRPDGTYETVQTKFVGKNPKECYSKLKSQKYSKYYEYGKVDKMEVAKDYYDEIKNECIPKDKIKVQKQIDRMNAEGNTVEAAKLQHKLENINKLDDMLEASNVTKKEALFATEHPKLYAAKTMASQANKAGLNQAKQAAGLTAVVSGVENIQQYYDGEITGTEAVGNVAKDTAVAGSVGYVQGAVTKLAGGSCVPAAVITMGVTSYDDIKDFAEGDISGGEFAYNLGENAARTVGGVVGAAAGSVGGPVGSLAAGAVVSAGAAKAYEIKESASNFGDSVDETIGDFKKNIKDIFD